jgi:ferric-dicitrate binding protein FerR (iron transport regulator)
MKRPACTSTWQAEALEDGRLSGAERASFERHAASCAECARELRALVRLRQDAEGLPASSLTPLEHRRQRQALLRRASELCQRAPVQPRRRTFAAFVLSGALMAALSIGFGLRAWRSGSEASVALAAPTYRLDASPGASWQTIEEGAALRLRLGSGSFMLEVDKLTAAQRFVLELPDGELEVIGTHFGVRVEPEGTRRVEVTEGRVALRLRDTLPISLGPGESWTAEREAARAAAPPSVPAAEPPSTPAPRATAPSERAAAPPPAASLARARPTALPETKRVLEPPSGEQAAALGTRDDDFARAMAAFGAGDYGQAERLFQDFERRHAEDARQEDSTFLRAVARARRGDAAGARDTARQYLERYPNGLRAPEAERLARPREAAENPKRER